MAIVFDEVTGVVAPPEEPREQAEPDPEGDDSAPRPAIEVELRAVRRLERRLARLRAD